MIWVGILNNADDRGCMTSILDRERCQNSVQS